jgi:[ribosomal protein S5]-alanine N-acetyltransferase
VTAREIDDEVAEGQLIRLRRKRMSDAENDYRWRCDPEMARFDAAAPLRAPFNDFLVTYREDVTYPSPFRRVYAIEALDGTHIGNVMYYNIDDARGEAELGITIGDRRFWGTGYGRDAVRTFQHVHMRRIYLNTLDWNVRAQRSFAAAGFVQYGTSKRGMHSFVSMEILREWLADELERPSD